MKKIFTLIIVLLYSISCVYAVDFDTTIDESIRKNYNLTQNEEELPALPNVVPTDTPETEKPQSVKITATGKTYTLKGGTKIKLSSKSVISDRLRPGNKVTFYSVNGFQTKENTIIPSGTLFKGRVLDAHTPQITGNGGLIVITIDEMYFNGVKSQIEAKVSMANWKNVVKVTKPGRKVFGSTQTASSAMSAIPILNIISFIPLVGGAVVYTANLICAPVIALFTKGGSISIPPNTLFEYNS